MSLFKILETGRENAAILGNWIPLLKKSFQERQIRSESTDDVQKLLIILSKVIFFWNYQ